jgi:hypothetical protein
MRVTGALLKRVQRLEAASRSRPAESVNSEDPIMWRFAEQLLGEIDPSHAQRIKEDLASSGRMRRPSEWSGMTLAFVSRVADHVKAGTPLAFPTAVGEAYLGDPGAVDEASCQKCHYKLPRGCFRLCPVCGGSVGFISRSAPKVAAPERTPGASEAEVAA